MLTPKEQRMYLRMMTAPLIIVYPWLQLFLTMSEEREEHRKRSMHLRRRKK